MRKQIERIQSREQSQDGLQKICLLGELLLNFRILTPTLSAEINNIVSDCLYSTHYLQEPGNSLARLQLGCVSPFCNVIGCSIGGVSVLTFRINRKCCQFIYRLCVQGHAGLECWQHCYCWCKC